MASLFDSPRLTLVRAQHHIDDFKSIINGFLDPQPWAYVVDNKSEPGKDVHKIIFNRDLPEMLPCVLFDATNNLRAVLDQIGYASAVAAQSPSLKATKFPFGPTEEKWRNNLAGGSKDVPSEIRALFETLNAYEGGNATLWALNELANAKKHLALVPLMIGSARATFRASVPDGTKVGHIIGPDGVSRGWNPTKREMILITVEAGFDPHISGNFSFNVAIESIDVIRIRPAVDVLQEMRKIVESVLVASERECRRLFEFE
jgi:hypothetical protein